MLNFTEALLPQKWYNDEEIPLLLCLPDLANLKEPPSPRTFQNKTFVLMTPLGCTNDAVNSFVYMLL